MVQNIKTGKINQSSMDQIVLGVAHEINNPNTFIRINSSNLKKMLALLGPVLDESEKANPDVKYGPFTLPELRSKIVQCVESISQATIRIISIADSLKACTAGSLESRTKVSLKDVVESVIEMHQYLLDAHSELEFEMLDTSEYEIKGHRLQLEQALSVLLTNSVDAIKEKFKDKKGRIKIVLENKKDTTVLTFEDNGSGIDIKTQEKMFVPYFTTKPQGVGDGLGMPICQSIVEKHGGKISVKSQKGSGTQFFLAFPKGEIANG